MGAVQSALLKAVHEVYTDLRPELWLCVPWAFLGFEVHRESRRRAAHSLAEAGLVELHIAPFEVPNNSGYHLRPGLTRNLLFAREPLGPISADYVRELREEHGDQLLIALSSEHTEQEREQAFEWMKWYQAPEARGFDLETE